MNRHHSRHCARGLALLLAAGMTVLAVPSLAAAQQSKGSGVQTFGPDKGTEKVKTVGGKKSTTEGTTSTTSTSSGTTSGGTSGGGDSGGGTLEGTQIINGILAPSDPAGLQVQPLSAGGFKLTWQDRSSIETGFQIERQPEFATGSMRVAANVTEFVDGINSQRARYRVRALGTEMNSQWTAWVGGETIRPEGFAIIRPGTGFTGPTPQPPRVGAPNTPGADAKAIARWDVVPFQTFDGDFHIGVVAFHINGIDRVEFSANGGPWVAVREMQLNPRTNVWEYTALLRASDFQDGPVEVRAIAWPRDGGEARVLDSLALNANASQRQEGEVVFVSPNGSDSQGDGSELNPYKSIMKAAKVVEILQGGNAGGGTIYLLPGEHAWGPAARDADGNYIGRPRTEGKYLHVTAAPGVARDEVHIVYGGSGGLKTELLRLRRVTIRTAIINAVVSQDSSLWLDECAAVGTGRTDNIIWMPRTLWPGGRYATNTTVKSARSGLGAATLARSCRIENIGDDAFSNPMMVIDCDVVDVRIPPGSGYHTDLVQFHGSEIPVENRIIYGLRSVDCVAQGFHIGYTGHVQGPDWADIAIVNSVFSYEGYTSQWIPRANHVLWWNTTIVGGPVMIRENPGGGLPTEISNLSIVGCVFGSLRITSSTIPSVMSHNHFITSTPLGEASSFGDPKFLSANHLRPAHDSPLIGRILAPMVKSDANGDVRSVPSAVGAMEPLSISPGR